MENNMQQRLLAGCKLGMLLSLIPKASLVLLYKQSNNLFIFFYHMVQIYITSVLVSVSQLDRKQATDERKRNFDKDKTPSLHLFDSIVVLVCKISCWCKRKRISRVTCNLLPFSCRDPSRRSRVNFQTISSNKATRTLIKKTSGGQ